VKKSGKNQSIPRGKEEGGRKSGSSEYSGKPGRAATLVPFATRSKGKNQREKKARTAKARQDLRSDRGDKRPKKRGVERRQAKKRGTGGTSYGKGEETFKILLGSQK